MFRAIVFFGLITLAFASATLDVLVNAAASFLGYDPAMPQSDPEPAELAKALREELPELMNIAKGRKASPPELDTFAAAFAVAGEKQEVIADQETLVLLKRFSRNPDIEKARMEFERAQKVEQRFHKDFEGLDFTMSVACRIGSVLL